MKWVRRSMRPLKKVDLLELLPGEILVLSDGTDVLFCSECGKWTIDRCFNCKVPICRDHIRHFTTIKKGMIREAPVAMCICEECERDYFGDKPPEFENPRSITKKDVAVDEVMEAVE